jgi:hypothetical protein
MGELYTDNSNNQFYRSVYEKSKFDNTFVHRWMKVDSDTIDIMVDPVDDNLQFEVLFSGYGWAEMGGQADA